MKTIDELYDFIKASHPDAVRDGNAITVSGQSLYLSSLKELPEGVSLTAGWSLYLDSLEKLPEGVSLTAGWDLNLDSLKELPEGVSLTAGRVLNLDSLKELPEGVSLTAGENLNLRSLKELPEGVSLTAGENLNLRSLEKLPEGVSLTAGWDLNLSSLKELPEGVSLTAGWDLNLSSLKELPEGVSLTAGENLNLRSLEKLPEGVSLTAGWSLYLKGLESPYQRYKGKDIYLVNVDGDAMQRLSAPRTVEDCSVWKAAYFNGTENQRTCYVAECGEFTAHGDSIAMAIRDVRFKHLQATLDTDQLVEEIKAKGTVTFNEYRLLTGACESGLREGLASLGLPEDTQCLPLEEVIRVSAGQYGGETIERLFT